MNLSSINFRSLVESDFEVLCAWLNLSHMQVHYQKEPVSFQDVRQKYLPRLDTTHPVHCHIAIIDGCPVGQFQSYRISDYRDYAAEIGVEEGVSIDFFIGDENFLGRGFGTMLLERYVSSVVRQIFPDEPACYVCHAESNHRAIRCSVGAGFEIVKNVLEDGTASVLLRYVF